VLSAEGSVSSRLPRPWATSRTRNNTHSLRVKIDRGFSVQVATTLVVVGGIVAYPLVQYGSSEIVAAAIVGALLSTVNVLLGYLTIEYSFQKSYTTFLKAVLGGMGVRMAAMLGVVIALIKILAFHVTALIVSMLGFYAIFLVLEVLFIQKKFTVKNQR